MSMFFNIIRTLRYGQILMNSLLPCLIIWLSILTCVKWVAVMLCFPVQFNVVSDLMK